MTEAYVTLATNDRYALGALVLAHSLRRVQTTKQLCVLITPGVSDALRNQLIGVFNGVVVVDVMDSNDSAHLALLKRPELGVTFTKLHCWTLTQYTKCVFLDADILAVKNSDELFEQPELSAVCDIGWPDCFNSGMFVFSPSQDTYKRLLQHADNTGSFDGGDQGLLNTFFTDWNRLSFIYNMVASVTYTYLPAYKRYGSNVKFVHFLGATKPWQQAYHVQSGSVVTKPGQEHISSHLNTWWNIFSSSVKPELPESVAPAAPPEINTPVQEYKQSEDKELYEKNTYDTFSHSYQSEHINTYHDNQYNEQVMVTKNEYDTDNSVKHSHNNSLGFVEQSYTQVKSLETSTDIIQVPNTLTDIETASSPEYNTSNTQDSENKAPSPYTSSENTLDSGVSPSDNECRRSASPFEKNASGAQGEQQKDSNFTSHLVEQLCSMNVSESLEEGRKRWEQGTPDFRGRDSFDNILAHIEAKINSED